MPNTNQAPSTDADRVATLTAIAQEHLFVDTLAESKSSADFTEQAIWCLHAALDAAYEAGRAAATRG